MASGSFEEDRCLLMSAGGVAKPAALSKEERRWILRLQRCLEACPSRLEILTNGGRNLQIIDGPSARDRPIWDGWAERSGVVLATIDGGPKVHGVSG